MSVEGQVEQSVQALVAFLLFLKEKLTVGPCPSNGLMRVTVSASPIVHTFAPCESSHRESMGTPGSATATATV